MARQRNWMSAAIIGGAIVAGAALLSRGTQQAAATSSSGMQQAAANTDVTVRLSPWGRKVSKSRDKHGS